MDAEETNRLKRAGKPYQLTAGVWMVPCRMDKNKKNYIPSIRPFKNVKILQRLNKSFSRHIWTPEEDEVLKAIVEKLGPKQWSSVASQLNIELHKGLPIRFGKQCRERWLGSLNPVIEKSPWTIEEDNILVSQQMVIGNRWRLINEKLPGRTENQIKNRWRKLNKLMKSGHTFTQPSQPDLNSSFFEPWMFINWLGQFSDPQEY